MTKLKAKIFYHIEEFNEFCGQATINIKRTYVSRSNLGDPKTTLYVVEYYMEALNASI